MLIFDELKKNDPQLRLVAAVLAGGLSLLLAGLWWVQIVSAGEYESHLETQAYRTVRIPAVRGKILDRNGRVLAENRPQYNLGLYLDDLRKQFDTAYSLSLNQLRTAQQQFIAAREKQLRRPLTKDERRQMALTAEQREQVREQARFRVASDMVRRVSQRLGQPLVLDAATFDRHYDARRALPYPLLTNLDTVQIARFEEQYSGLLGVDLDLQAVRVYPFGETAGHLLGYLQREDKSQDGEDPVYNYRLPDYHGIVGIEGGFDAELRGRAGAEAVLVNNMGYRQSENVLSPSEPGHNVVLTLDMDIEQAAVQSLERQQGADVRAAVVVMDVRTGDVLAMVSSPAINPDYAANDPKYLADPELHPQINRATQENYAPGSIFKPVIGLAALEAGLDPDAMVDNPGYVYVGRRHIKDLAPPGQYNLRRAIIFSSNTYFITVGLRTGIENLVRMAGKFHFGERTGLPTRQETAGIFPSLTDVNSASWRDGDSANLCIGQGQMAVTPIQMAVAYAAIANGGTVLWPRLVERIEPQDPASSEAPTVFPSGVVRDELDVHPRNLKILRDAMLAETQEGTGQAAQVPGLQICGKTGTAQVMNSQNQEIDRTTWFASFAPYENPRYTVVVMMEGRTFWGATCAAIAHDIYGEIVKRENADTPNNLAEANH
jgi:penicillin-binding protein 2